MAKKDEFLTQFKTYNLSPASEEVHFALISEREGILNKAVSMIENAEREINVVTCRNWFLQNFTYCAEALENAVRRGIKVRVVLDVSAHDDSILRIVEECQSSRVSFDLKYKDQPSSHYFIIDYKQALIATTKDASVGGSCLWTDDNTLSGLLQKDFEDLWHTSVDINAIETDAVAEKLLYFLKTLKPTNHIIFLYEALEAKYTVLFNYAKVGLENSESVLYIASEETPSEIRAAMERFGIEVETYTKTGALHILSYDEFYIFNGKSDLITTLGLINKLYNEAFTKGFKGFRAVGELACFFEHNLTQELIGYERALGRALDLPIIAVCACNTKTLTNASDPIDIYTDLLKAHGTILFTGIENKLGRIEIRKV